jgi:hypothetical protein
MKYFIALFVALFFVGPVLGQEIHVSDDVVFQFSHDGLDVNGNPETLGKSEILFVGKDKSPTVPTDVLKVVEVASTTAGNNDVDMSTHLPSLPEGKYDVYVRTYDLGGQVSPFSDKATIVLDRTAPKKPGGIIIIIKVVTE